MEGREIDKGRGIGYRWRGRVAAAAGFGAVAIAAMMMLSPAATAASGGIVIHAKYHGAVSPSNDIYQDGCGKAKLSKPWNFKTKTGIGGFESVGKANVCGGSLGNVGGSSDAQVDGGFDVAIPLKISSSATSVALNAAWKGVAAVKSSDGFAGTTTPTCNAPIYSYDDSGSYYEWNYTVSPYGYSYFSDYNYSYNYTYTGGSYGYSYGNAPVPSPFNLNNTSYEDVYSDYGADSSCQSYSDVYLDAYSYLVDTTSGYYESQTGDTIGTYGTLLDTSVEVYNDTDWSCDSSTYWYGPSNYSYIYPLTCYSYNTSLTSYIFTYVPTYTYSTGTNNTQTWGGSFSGSGSMWWNDTFTTGDQYVLQLQVYGDAYVYNSWKHGTATYDFNLATGGNGFDLKSITIT